MAVRSNQESSEEWPIRTESTDEIKDHEFDMQLSCDFYMIFSSPTQGQEEQQKHL